MTRKEEREHAAYDFVNTDSVTVDNHILAFNFFTTGARWADKTMLDNVCKYLYRKLENGKKLSSQLIDNLRKEMEE